MRRLRLALRVLVLASLVAGEGAAQAHLRRAPTWRSHRQRASSSIALVYRGPAPRLVLVDIVKEQERPPLRFAPSYYEVHAQRVQKDFLSFQFILPGDNPAVDRKPAIVDPDRPKLSFVAPETAEDPLQQRRELDRLELFRDSPEAANSGAVSLGLGMFIAAVVGAAHAPRELRFLFDGPLRLGPAIFQGGGMGAGLGATYL